MMTACLLFKVIGIVVLVAMAITAFASLFTIVLVWWRRDYGLRKKIANTLYLLMGLFFIGVVSWFIIYCLTL